MRQITVFPENNFLREWENVRGAKMVFTMLFQRQTFQKH